MVVIKDASQKTEPGAESSGAEAPADDQGKIFDASLNFPPIPSSSTSTNQPLFPLEEVNHGSFCRSSSTSPLEDDVHSPTSMEVLVPEGEEQDLSSIIEGMTRFFFLHVYDLLHVCLTISMHFEILIFFNIFKLSLQNCMQHVSNNKLLRQDY